MRHLLARLGPWSQPHEHIFSFLIEPRTFSDHARNKDARMEDLVEVRPCGLLQGTSVQHLDSPPVGSEDQRAFAKRYRMGDLDWIPSSASLCPNPFQEHVLVWHPPMVPTPWGAFEDLSEELARSAGHPLSSAISNRLVRALGVAGRPHTAAMQGHDLRMAPCRWRGQFVESCCDGVPASTSSRGWLCEFRVCRLCRCLYGRCRQCCVWTGLPARASEEAIELCRRSQVDLGEVARVYRQEGRLPFELLPWPLQLHWRRFRAGEAHAVDAAESRMRWIRSLVCHALSEEPPPEMWPSPRVSPPRDLGRQHQASLQSVSPCTVLEMTANLRMRLRRFVSVLLRLEDLTARAYVLEPAPEFKDLDLESLLTCAAGVDDTTSIRAQLEAVTEVSQQLRRCEVRLDEELGLRWYL